MAREFSESLAKAGLVIVSGLAIGIDAVAHEAAIDVGGRTVAVLGSGVDRITPAENRPLGERILDHDGAIVSQFPEGSRAFKQHFPVRNLTISGMCLGTLVIEASKGSGSIITAKAANDQGRAVFGVPGPIDAPMSQGINDMLKSFGHLVTSVNDILDVLHLSGVAVDLPPTPPVKADTKEEAIILPLLSKKPKHIDVIIREARLTTTVVTSAVTLMEINGKIRHVGGNHYIIA